jgi:hypothetical protein
MGTTTSYDDERIKRYRENKGKAIQRIEDLSDRGDINVDELIREATEWYPGQPTWMLLQDIQRQAVVYWNVIETLKRVEPRTPNFVDAAMIKNRYVWLRLVPEDNKWPNPDDSGLINWAFNKIEKYRRALVDIVRTRSIDLMRELNFDPRVQVTFEVTISFPPGVTIGMALRARILPLARLQREGD